VAVGNLRVGDARVVLLFARVAQYRESVALTDVKVDGQLELCSRSLGRDARTV
jgi:hypothetical protein